MEICKYDFKKIESLAMDKWSKSKCFKAKNLPTQKKYYILPMFPYPSGDIHMGHVRNYTLSDVDARFRRLNGYDVLHPIGWDSFGLPAENASIENKCTPVEWTEKNINQMKKQLLSLGLSFDWDRELRTSDPNYFVIEQKFFIKLLKAGIAYKSKCLINWCNNDKTVLANEQVIDGKCWRCDSEVIKKLWDTWFLNIKSKSNELIDGLKHLKLWPKEVKKMQNNWIGEIDSIELNSYIESYNYNLNWVLPTPELYGGLTFILLSPNDHLVKLVCSNNNRLNELLNRLNSEIKKGNKDSTNFGFYLGINIDDPLINGKKIGLWVADMESLNIPTVTAWAAIPAHYRNVYNFAKTHNIEIINTVEENKKFTNINTETEYTLNKPLFLKNTKLSESKSIIIKRLEEKKYPYKLRKIYRLRDWSISRQRYWGAPIPVLINTKDNSDTIPEKESNLPVELPQLQNNHIKNNLLENLEREKIIIDNKEYQRSPETFDTFIESSWYYARYTIPGNNIDDLIPEYLNAWLPIDHYIGGIEHATLHLIYIRYFHKLLKDFGYVNTDEPINKLTCQGMVLNHAFYKTVNNKKIWVSPKDVVLKRDINEKIISSTDKNGDSVNYAGIFKMSKSKKNGIDPKDLINNYGADTVRLYTLFAAPPQASLIWQDSGLNGAKRFLEKIWNFSKELTKYDIDYNNSIIKVNELKLGIELEKFTLKITDIYLNKFLINVAIATIMEFFNLLNEKWTLNDISKQEAAFIFSYILQALNPVSPHITSVIWSDIFKNSNIEDSKWVIPTNIKKENKTKLVVQINGKKVDILVIDTGLNEMEILEIISNNTLINKKLNNKKILKHIYIPNKILNFVLENL